MAKRGKYPIICQSLRFLKEKSYEFYGSRMAAVPYWVIMLIIAIVLVIIMWMILGKVSNVFE